MTLYSQAKLRYDLNIRQMLGVDFENCLICCLANPYSIVFAWGKIILANPLNRRIIATQEERKWLPIYLVNTRFVGF